MTTPTNPRSEAARMLGSARSERKARTSAENGKLGGRPKAYNPFGEVEYNGKTYILTDQAHQTNRLFHGSFNDQNDDGSYAVEYACPARRGRIEYTVYWQFPVDNDHPEPDEEDGWPWDDKYITSIYRA